jgi:hypothetical protein
MSILAKVKALHPRREDTARFQEGREEPPVPTPEVRAHNEAAREALGSFFREVIHPRLDALFKAGKLPQDWALKEDWLQVEEAWNQCADPSPVPCDVGRVKGLMTHYMRARAMTRGGSQGPLFPGGGNSGRFHREIRGSA